MIVEISKTDLMDEENMGIERPTGIINAGNVEHLVGMMRMKVPGSNPDAGILGNEIVGQNQEHMVLINHMIQFHRRMENKDF